MKYYKTENIGRIYTLRIDPGDYILESINEFINQEGIKNGVVISGIGTLDYCTLHMVCTTGYPPQEHFEKWEDSALELNSIDGIIANGVPHLHTVISDKEKAYGGHLEEGCRVLYLCEIVIMELSDIELDRVPNDKGILQLIQKNK